MNQRSSRFALIPWYVLQNKNITHAEKLLVALINSLSIESGYAWPSNDYLAQAMVSDDRQIRRWLEHLEAIGIIQRKFVTGRDGQSQRLLSIRMDYELPGGGVNHPEGEGEFHPEGEGVNHPVKEKVNLTINNKIKDKEKEQLIFSEIWELYGKRGGKQPAYKNWLLLSRPEREEVIAHIPTYISHHLEADKAEFIPHMATYLSQRRWESALPYESKLSQSNPWKQIKW